MASYERLRHMDFNLHARGPKLVDPRLGVTTITLLSSQLSRIIRGLWEEGER